MNPLRRALPRRPHPATVAIVASTLVVAVVAGVWASRVAAPKSAPAPAAVRVHPVDDARLSAVVARLDRARVAGRAALERARTRSAQVSLARRLGDVHRTAAARLPPMAGERTLTGALLHTGRAYGVLAAAASDESPARFAAARRRARAAEATLASAVDEALRAGAPPVVRRAASPKPYAIWTDRERLLVVLVVLLISAAAGVSVGAHGRRAAA